MPDNLNQQGDLRRRRLSNLIITRSPSSRGEVPEDNLAERDSEERARRPIRVERGDTGEVEQEG